MAQSERRLDALGLAASAAFGVAAFFAFAGWRFLDPSNVGWLRVGDRAMHTLGWWFFRFTPWGWPLGVNPRNGLEISSSVALSDSLPFFAIPFKLLSPLLPETFQYWGIWYLSSMVLQALFGYLLARQLRLSPVASFLAAACLVFTPVFLWRMPVHMALSGHWLLLAALYLYVKQLPPRLYAWPLLLAVTASVHAYILAMVLAIWAASLLERLWRGRIGWARAAVEMLIGGAATGFVMWACGFLMTSSLGAEGFGFYRMNLWSFLDTNGWSFMLPNLPSSDGDYEGESFPGLGVLLLLAIGLLVALPRLRVVFGRRWLPLLLAVIALGLFALSNKVVVGNTELFTVPLPAQVLNFASMFRASGRMIWPACYLVVLLAFVLVDRRLGARALIALASLALVVQIADTSGQWTRFANEAPATSSTWPTPIKAPFWSLAAKHFQKLRAIPVKALNDNWAELSYFAAFHGMASDAAYLGRRDDRGFKALSALAEAAVAEGHFEPDALYVLDPMTAVPVRPFVAPADLFGRVDGFIVFARDGKALLASDGVDLPPVFPDMPSLPIGTPVAFAAGGQGTPLLLDGWGAPEDWGTWSVAPQAFLSLSRRPDAPGSTLHLVLRGYASNPKEPQETDISINGVAVRTVTLPLSGDLPVDLPLPPAVAGRPDIVGFVVRHPQTPAGADPHRDPRRLGIGLISLSLLSAPV